jgi:hypothetical protein
MYYFVQNYFYIIQASEPHEVHDITKDLSVLCLWQQNCLHWLYSTPQYKAHGLNLSSSKKIIALSLISDT